MVNLLNLSQIKFGSQVQSPASNKTTKASIFYVNDVHSNLTNMERIKSASDEFDAFVSSKDCDKLKLSAGDFALGSNVPLNNLAVAAENSMHIMASAGGNHEFDLLKKDLSKVFEKSNYKVMGLNVDIPETTDSNKELKTEITKSYIQEQNGTKYGMIGLFPFDFLAHVTVKNEYKDFNIIPLDKTKMLIQQEVDKLKSKGVNKIIILSHAGYNADVEIAKSVEGIDAIIGGHSHDLIEGIQEGKNLFYSKKTGEPTIITQAGKDGKYFGVLNLEFNENGVITKAQNNVSKTENYPKSAIMKFLVDKFLGKPIVVGRINSAPNEPPSLVKENACADLLNDAVRSELNVDIAMLNSANIRSQFEPGDLTDRDIAELTPFKNKMAIVKLTEKEVVDAVKNASKSMNDKQHMPGLAQFSGLRYTLTKKGEVKNIVFVDKTGKEIQIDINNPNPNKIYRVGLDSFLLRGGNGYISDKTEQAEKIYDFDKDFLVVNYIKKLNKPIDIKPDGRITIVD